MKLLESESLVLGIVLYCSIAAFAEVDDGSVLHSGEATYYWEGGIGHCGFPEELQPLYHGAMNHTDYDTAAPCGTWVHITGPKGEIDAFIDDECPECQPGDIDLGPVTFQMIADSIDGRVPITWHYIPAPDSVPMKFYWKDGSSQWHIEVQVRDHTYGITRLFMKTASSEWVELSRQEYNFFKLPGGINGDSGPYDIRVIDIFDREFIEYGVELAAESISVASGNFSIISTPLAYQRQPLSRTTDGGTSQIHVVPAGRRIRANVPERCRYVELFTPQGRRYSRVTVRNGTIELPRSVRSQIIIIRESTIP